MQFAKETKGLENMIDVEIDEEDGLIYFKTENGNLIDQNQITIILWLIAKLKTTSNYSNKRIMNMFSDGTNDPF